MGRTEIFRRVSRASRQSFRGAAPPPPPPIQSNGINNLVPIPLNPPVTPKTNRKTSLETVVKQSVVRLTDLAVTISGDGDKASKNKSAHQLSPRTNHQSLVEKSS